MNHNNDDDNDNNITWFIYINVAIVCVKFLVKLIKTLENFYFAFLIYLFFFFIYDWLVINNDR